MYRTPQHAMRPSCAAHTKRTTTPDSVGARFEWQTWLLIATIYGGWTGTVLGWHSLGPLLGTSLLIVFSCWYMSLQHELIHGHPTRSQRLNTLLGMAPLAVWYPYPVYRDTHLAHHHDDSLTLPGSDPESYYLRQGKTPTRWRAIVRWRNTAPGRLLLGPALGWFSTLAGAYRQRDHRTALIWSSHLLLVTALLYGLWRAGIHPLHYLLGVAYPALSLAMVRSFYEHRAQPAPAARSVINEAALPWRLLFLNLNYHLVHHQHPGVAWYRLRPLFLARRAHYLQQCAGFHETGYLPLLWRHRRQPVISEFHPFA
ncbi:fatty acid desaturase [Vogesella sp. GCM10023246]|uniref:Fatty acid desaturase n=1 Tax=Vogesella oryzagri TaxID=3160864 RepID=A0ABV1M396_9NEIS